MRTSCSLRASAIAGAIVLGAALIPAHATVTAFFSAGTTCQGKPVIKFRAGGPSVTVTLCANATEEAICGHSIQLEAGSTASSGQFEIIKHKMGAHYPDPTLEKLPARTKITLPATAHDFGGTRDNPHPPEKNQVLATFTLKPPATAKLASYQIRLGKNSLVSVGAKGSCLENAEVPMSASMTFERD